MVAQNFLQGYLGGIQSGRQVADMRRQQELQNAFSQYGPGLVSGDQEAINAFAAIDPMTALQVQQSQDQARRAEQSYNMQVREHVARMSAAEKAQASAEMDQALSMMSGINDPASWDQVAQQYAPDLVGQFGQKDLLINRALGLKDALAMQQPPKPADEYGRYRQEEEAAGRQPLSRIDYAKAKQKSTTVEMGADGTVRISEGPSGGKASDMMDKPKKDYERVLNPATNQYEDRVIEGSETWNSLVDQSQKTKRSLDAFTSKNNIVLEDIDRAIEIIENSDLPATGMANWLTGGVPGTPAYRLNSLLQTITGNVAFGELQEMRDNSPTGGAVGQLSDSEREVMGTLQGNIQGANNSEDLVYNLRRLKEARQGMAGRISDAYNQDFAQVGRQVGVEGAAIEVGEIESLPFDDLLNIDPARMADMSPEALNLLVQRLEAGQ